jgi:hypothetical protein
MIGFILRFPRAIVGFVIACLAAGLTMALFVYSPLELVDLQSERLREVGLLSLAAARTARSSLRICPDRAGFGEWQRIGSWLYYVLVGIRHRRCRLPGAVLDRGHVARPASSTATR